MPVPPESRPLLVGEVMNRRPVTVHEDADLVTAAARGADRGERT
jgi:CBS domain-containing protein